MPKSGDENLHLTPEDERIVDALFADGFDPAQCDAITDEDARARASHLHDLMGLLRDYPVEDCDDTLVHATLARIDRAEEERAQRFAIDSERSSRSWSIGRLPLPNLISVAAIILIAVSVFWPILENLREQGRIQKQQNNLRAIATAVETYSGDYRGVVPMAKAGWDSPFSQAETEALNLTPIVQQNYLRIRHPDGRVTHTRMPDPDLVLFLGDDHPIVHSLRQKQLDHPMQIDLFFGTQGRNNLNREGVLLWLFHAQSESGLWQPRDVRTLDEDLQPVGTSH